MYDGMFSKWRFRDDDVEAVIVEDDCVFVVRVAAYESGGILQEIADVGYGATDFMSIEVTVEFIGVECEPPMYRYGLKTSFEGKIGGADKGFGLAEKPEGSLIKTLLKLLINQTLTDFKQLTVTCCLVISCC
jgi:hypothetical protein